MIVTIYKSSNGEILKIIDAPSDMIEMQLQVGENYILGEYNDDLYYIQNGAPKLKPPSKGDDYVWNPDTKEWVYNKTEQDFVTEAIIKRNDLLLSSDWTQLPDVNVDKSAWAVYRQELRDITEQAGFPITIEWPIAPNGE